MKTILLSFFFISVFYVSSFATVTSVGSWPNVSELKISQQGNNVSLSWIADSDPSVISYEIEKSVDGKTFKTAAIVLGGYEMNGIFSFQFRDKKADKAVYRIKQFNADGTYRIVGEQSL